MTLDWKQTWHEAVCDEDGPNAICSRCGVTRDRAIHTKWYAEENGFEFIPATESDS